MFDTSKTRIIGLPCGEKNYNNTGILSRFHTGLPERNGQTDGQMDRQTDEQHCYINIARQCELKDALQLM